MYYYIVDQGNISLPKFERLLVELQGLLGEFHVSGEMSRVTQLRSVADLVDTANQRGTKTLVAVGSDDTFVRMLAELRGKDFALGFVPLTEESFLKKIFGIESLYDAVKVIAARRIEKIDLGVVSPSTYFLSYLEFGSIQEHIKQTNFWNLLKPLKQDPETIKIKIDDSYVVESKCLGGMVVNVRPTSSSNKTIANPTDSFLDVLVLEYLTRTDLVRFKDTIINGQLEEIPRTSVIKCRKVEIVEPRGLPILLSGRVVAKAPAAVQIIPQRLRMIVGKHRTF